MRFEQLEYLLAIDECKSINKAAKKLFLTPQALNASLNAIEEELGYEVFLRRPTGVERTYQGYKILEDSMRIVLMWREWMKPHDVAQTFIGELNISASSSCGFLSTLIIQNFCEKFPNINVNFSHINSMYLLNNPHVLLKEDLVLLAIEDNQYKLVYKDLQRKGYEVVEVCTDRIAVYISMQNDLVGKECLSIEDLYNERMVGYGELTKENFFGSELISCFHRGVSFRVNSWEYMLNFVADNKAIGFGLYSSCTEKDFIQRKIKTLLLEDYYKEIKICIARPKKKQFSDPEQYLFGQILSYYEGLKEENIVK